MAGIESVHFHRIIHCICNAVKVSAAYSFVNTMRAVLLINYIIH